MSNNKPKITLEEGDSLTEESSTDPNNSVFKFLFGGLINKVTNLFKRGDFYPKNSLEISSEDRMNLKHGAFGILLTALILTIFEIAFFYVLVIPGVNENKNDGLKKIGYDLSVKFREMVKEQRKKVLEMKIVTENDILNLFFYDFNDSQIGSITNIFNQLGITLPDGTTLPAGMNWPTGMNPNSEGFVNDQDYGFNKKEYLKTRIIESELDDKFKNELLKILENPEDYQIQKKKVVLKLLDSKLPEKLATLETMEAREKKLRDKINIYVLITGFVIIGLVLFFLFKLKKSINNDPNRKEFKSEFKYSIWSAICTVVIIIIFQYTFFLLGTKYIYTIKGLTLCGDRDINTLKFIYKKKYNKDISDEEAQEIIFKKSLKDPNYVYDETYEDEPDNCLKNGAHYNDKTKLCHKRFYSCHYLSKDAHKYGTGKNELGELVMQNIETR